MKKIDVTRLLGAVTRETSTRELDGKPAVAVIASRTYDTSIEEFEKTYGPGAGGVGWELAFAGLDLHLSSPSDAPTPTDIEAWLQTESGNTFIRGASDAWGAAAIAAGTSDVLAREAAQRTAEFYTRRACGS